MNNDTPEITIVCVPRERFDFSFTSLASLYEKTPLPFQFVYVDNALPRQVRTQLMQEADARGFEVVRTSYPMPPNAARNFGLAHAKGRYVVFVDNDVVFDDAWLESLLACMKETKATVAAPLVCQYAPYHTIVHCAGGEFMGPEQFEQFRQQPLPEAKPDPYGKRLWRMEEKIYLQDEPVETVGTERREVGFVEFHCFMVDAGFLRAHGGFDPELTATKEYVDLAMIVARAGGKILIEPASRVTFLTHPPQPILKLSEIPYFMLRWSDAWEKDSLKHLAAKWDLVEDEYFTNRYKRLGWRRRSELITPMAMPFQIFGKPFRKWVKRQLVKVDKKVNAYVTRRHAARLAKHLDGEPVAERV